MAVYKGPENLLSIRIDAAKAAIAYEKPRLQAVEHTGKNGEPIETKTMQEIQLSDESLARLRALVE